MSSGARRRRRCGATARYTVRHGAGLDHVRARARGIATELTLGLRRTIRGQALACSADQPGDRPRRLSVTRATSSGPWACCASTRSTRCRPTFDRGARRDPRAQHLRPAVRRAGGVLRAERAAHGPHRRPARVPRPQRHRRRAGRARRCRSPARTGAGLDPCAALQCGSSSRPARRASWSCCSARPTATTPRAGALDRYPRRAPSARGGRRAARRPGGPSGCR